MPEKIRLATEVKQEADGIATELLHMQLRLMELSPGGAFNDACAGIVLAINGIEEAITDDSPAIGLQEKGEHLT